MPTSDPQPTPAPPTWDVVIAETEAMRDRMEPPDPILDQLLELMRTRSRQDVPPLCPFGGRDSLAEALTEVLDLCVRLRTDQIERPNLMGDMMVREAIYLARRITRRWLSRDYPHLNRGLDTPDTPDTHPSNPLFSGQPLGG